MLLNFCNLSEKINYVQVQYNQIYLPFDQLENGEVISYQLTLLKLK